jgi:ABC-2 type transport system permease protein
MVSTKRRSPKVQALFRVLMILGILVLLNFTASHYYKRIDLTKEKRYTLSNATKSLLQDLDDQVYIRVYLEGEFPAGFKRLRNATEEMLYEFKDASAGKVQFVFIDPSKGTKEEKEAQQKELYDKGLNPTNLKVKNEEGSSSQIIFPGLLMTYREKEVALQLLENQVGLGPDEALNNSIELLEYKIANTIKKATQKQAPRIGFLQGEGELNKVYLNDIAKTLTDYQYDIRLINLQEEVSLVNAYDIIVVAKPTTAFREQEKFKLDQFIMNGGSVLWLLDAVNMDMDSLRTAPMYMAQPYDLNLDDQLFRYGVRLNPDLVQDLQSTGIPLVVGAGSPPQTEFFKWFYYPIITSANNHAIVNNLDAVLMQFAGTIDTIRVPNVKKTILLTTSPYSKALPAPVRVHFDMLKEKVNEASFRQPNLPVAVLLEGKFTSAFKNRLAANTLQVYKDSLKIDYKEESDYAKMIVVADGDVIKNPVGGEGNVYPLGFYNYTGQTFANKDFILNCIEYLSDDAKLIETRNKEIKMRLLDRTRIKNEALYWRVLNMVAPLLLIAIFGLIYNFIRRRKYAQ